MSKHKAGKEILKRREEGKKHPQKQEPHSLGSRVWNLIVGVGVILGFVAIYFQFRPTIEVVTPTPTPDDSYQLFSNPFVIKNNSILFSVHDVHALCHVSRIWRGTPSAPLLEENNDFADYVPPVGELRAGDEHSIPCSSNVSSSEPIQRAEVALVLDYYRPWPFLGHPATRQGYRAIIRDGKAYWTPYVEQKRPLQK